MKVLVVVDLQYDFIDGALGTPEAQAIVPKVADAIRNVSEDTVVIFTKDTHEENYMDTLEGKKLPVPHCIRNTKGWLLDDEVCKAYGDVYSHTIRMDDIIPSEFYGIYNELYAGIIEKPTFGSITLQNVLYALDDAQKIEEITLMGLCTGICVLSNATLAKATLPEVEVNVVADCCACVTPESHKTALDAMKMCQINII